MALHRQIIKTHKAPENREPKIRVKSAADGVSITKSSSPRFFRMAFFKASSGLRVVAAGAAVTADFAVAFGVVGFAGVVAAFMLLLLLFGPTC
jgi:hypothetical protein